MFGWQGRDLFPELDAGDRSFYLMLWLVVGAFALLGFVWVLAGGSAGRMTRVDGLVILLGMSSPLGLPAAVYTLAMVTSWLRWRPIVIGFVLATAGALLDGRLQAKSSPGPDVFVGALALMVAAGLVGLWWGRRRRAEEQA